MSGHTESTWQVTPCAAMPSSRSSTGSMSLGKNGRTFNP